MSNLNFFFLGSFIIAHLSDSRWNQKKLGPKINTPMYGDAVLELIRMSSNTADGNQQKHLLPSFATKAWIYS